MTYTKDNFSLEDLRMTVEDIVQLVRGKGIGTDFENVATRTANNALKFNDIQSQYAYYVDEYLSVKEPFYWNRQQPKNDSEWENHFRSDVQQFTTLVEYALWAGASTKVLDKWALWYPMSDGGPGLAESPSEYKGVLTQTMNQGSNEKMRACFQYLIKHL